MSAHTPGPWIARGETVSAHRPHVCGGYNEESVLSLTRPPAERIANARLVAAAPELFEALRALIEHHAGMHEPDEYCEDWCDPFRKAAAALAKARGETARAERKTGPQENP